MLHVLQSATFSGVIWPPNDRQLSYFDGLAVTEFRCSNAKWQLNLGFLPKRERTGRLACLEVSLKGCVTSL